MQAWILILFTWVYGSNGVVMSSTRFDNHDACIAARDTIAAVSKTKNIAVEYAECFSAR